ncbi:MAG: hypothetical protein WC460_00940 [Patescibacteria group bacterium]
MKGKTFNWMAIILIVLSLGFLSLLGCGTHQASPSVGAFDTPVVPPTPITCDANGGCAVKFEIPIPEGSTLTSKLVDDGTVAVKNVVINGKTYKETIQKYSANLVTPGSPPAEIYIYSSIVNRQNTDPMHGINYSAQVVGGVLSVSITVPKNTYLSIGYSLANQNRVDNIRLNSVLLTGYKTLGTALDQYPVACFIINVDENNAVTVGSNPTCTETLYRLRVRVTGDTNGNNVYDPLTFDDPIIPYTGLQAGEDIRIQTSYWRTPTPGGIWQRLLWDVPTLSYSETFFSVLSGQSAWLTIHHPARDVTAPPGTYEHGYGVYADVIASTGGSTLCTTQLVHYIDFTIGADYWIGMEIQGINTTSNCVNQGGDTRGTPITL